MANYRIYEGSNIFSLSENKSEPLIEGVLYENDVAMIVAPPKTSKTVFSMQMSCSLSSGTPFLNYFDVPQPVRVLYIATEMKDDELKDRYIRTANFVPTNPENLILVCTKGTLFKFNTKYGRQCINNLVEKYKDNPPKVIFIDSVYRAFYGSLIKDDVVNAFLMEVDRLAAEFDAAVVLVHHMKKPSKDEKNREILQTDSDTYGSAFLLGSVDHLIRIETIRKEDAKYDRFVRCDTQRSGNIMTDIRIRLCQPDPLYFHIIGNNEVEKRDILQVLKSQTDLVDMEELMKKSRIGRTKLYQVLKELQNEGLIDKVTKKRKKLYGTKK